MTSIILYYYHKIIYLIFKYKHNKDYNKLIKIKSKKKYQLNYKKYIFYQQMEKKHSYLVQDHLIFSIKQMMAINIKFKFKT